MRYKAAKKSLFIKNREKIMQLLDSKSVAVILSNDQYLRSGDQYYPYRQNSDLFYLTGIEQEEIILVLFPGHTDKHRRAILFLKETDKKTEIWEGQKLTPVEVTDISGISCVMYHKDLEMTLRDLILKSDRIFINTNEYVKLSEKIPDRSSRFIHELKEKYPLHSFQRLAPMLTRLRVKKEQEEIEMIRKACQITKDAFNRILKFVKPGVMEYEVEAEITHEFLKQGATGHAYQPIIASGGNANILHYVKNDKKCQEGDLLLMDFGAEYGNYSADCTRTIPISGIFSKRQRTLYESNLRVLRKATELMVVGSSINEVHTKVCEIWEEEHIALGLYSKDEVKKQPAGQPLFMNYYMHGTSHFMGLDVHDVGAKDLKFEPGMVLTCEPAIYLKNENIGIRLENDILITEEGPVNLMENIPVEIEEIESLMQES